MGDGKAARAQLVLGALGVALLAIAGGSGPSKGNIGGFFAGGGATFLLFAVLLGWQATRRMSTQLFMPGVMLCAILPPVAGVTAGGALVALMVSAAIGFALDKPWVRIVSAERLDQAPSAIDSARAPGATPPDLAIPPAPRESKGR